MIEWYNNLSILEYCYFYVAIIATVFLIIQIVMMCFSLGGDVDVDGDVEVDLDSGISVFTVKSLTAFFAVGGWAGLLTASLLPNYLFVSAIVGIVCGVGAMFLVVFAIRGILKLQCDGTIEMEKLVDKNATVYVSIPAKRSGRGKVNLVAQGRFSEFDAVTDGEEKISVDETVKIIAVENEVLIVKKISD
ncbi:MAG: NfeD family protein [Clostridia bacterium]|nr:NfeD family protein [Clostridia bacterium]